MRRVASGGPSSHVAAVLAVTLALAAPALWNGYPLIYYDSEDYVNMSFTMNLIVFRTMPYAVFLQLAQPFGSLWPVVVAQCGLAAWVLHEAAIAFIPHRPLVAYVALGVLLAAATGLPWNVGQIMADGFTGLIVLGVAAIAFGKTRLSRPRRLGLALIVALGIAVHLSHVALAIGLILSLALIWLPSLRWSALPRPAMGIATLAVAVGVAAVPLIHWRATGDAFFSAGGRVLQLALFVQDDLVERYLDEVCPKGARLKLCPYKDDLPETTDDFLWQKTRFPFWTKLGGWIGMRDEADIIVPGIIHRFPLEVATSAVRNTVHQFLLVNLGEGLSPKLVSGRPGEFVDTLRARYPGDLSSFQSARQQQPPGIDFAWMDVVQTPLALGAAFVTLVVLGLAMGRGRRELAGLALVVLLGLGGNAFICGALSNPHDRYQNRIAWIAVFAAGAGIIALQKQQRPGVAAGPSRSAVEAGQRE